VIWPVEIILNGKTLQEVEEGFEWRHEFELFNLSIHEMNLMTFLRSNTLLERQRDHKNSKKP